MIKLNEKEVEQISTESYQRGLNMGIVFTISSVVFVLAIIFIKRFFINLN